MLKTMPSLRLSPKTNIDTQNDGLEKVDSLLKNGKFWYLCKGGGDSPNLP